MRLKMDGTELHLRRLTEPRWRQLARMWSRRVVTTSNTLHAILQASLNFLSIAYSYKHTFEGSGLIA